ncbi:MAG: MoaD/ThiS family protein [Candidatus Melainabacteria bacterium HGW-Melainabacteria-1]|nr:MAG: MoaD/ThiS family protein [Candidatus Melainabacteria bacterium HGW-Melainabacteria-1]
MRLRLMTFAQLREQLGPEIEIELPDGAKVSDLMRALEAAFPEPPALSSARLAINRRYVLDPEQILSAADEIALIPPVSGG